MKITTGGTTELKNYLSVAHDVIRLIYINPINFLDKAPFNGYSLVYTFLEK